MKFLRNLLLFAFCAVVAVSCGGGNTTISANATDSTGTTTGTGTGGTPTSGGGSSSPSSITLSWIAPTTWTNANPLALSDISGYRLYYGSSATNTPNAVTINNGTATQYTLSLPSGTYYFRMSTVDTNGVEGPMSAPVQKVL